MKKYKQLNDKDRHQMELWVNQGISVRFSNTPCSSLKPFNLLPPSLFYGIIP